MRWQKKHRSPDQKEPLRINKKMSSQEKGTWGNAWLNTGNDRRSGERTMSPWSTSLKPAHCETPSQPSALCCISLGFLHSSVLLSGWISYRCRGNLVIFSGLLSVSLGWIKCWHWSADIWGPGGNTSSDGTDSQRFEARRTQEVAKKRLSQSPKQGWPR